MHRLSRRWGLGSWNRSLDPSAQHVEEALAIHHTASRSGVQTYSSSPTLTGSSAKASIRDSS